MTVTAAARAPCIARCTPEAESGSVARTASPSLMKSRPTALSSNQAPAAVAETSPSPSLPAKPQASNRSLRRAAGFGFPGGPGSRKPMARRRPSGSGETQHQPSGPAAICGSSSGAAPSDTAWSASKGGPIGRRLRPSRPVRPVASARTAAASRTGPSGVSSPSSSWGRRAAARRCAPAGISRRRARRRRHAAPRQRRRDRR